MRCGLFKTVVCASIIVTCISGAAAFAAEVISSYSGGTGTFTGGIVAGNTFNAPGGVTFNSLGFVDAGNDGINASYPVGIFDTVTHTLLASTTVTPSSPLINGYRYANIPATTIGPGGSFTIAALLPSTMTDGWAFSSTLNLGPGFTGAGTGQFLGNNNALVFPTSNDAVTYNLVNASTDSVPEPASLAALGGAAAMLLMRRRRRRARTSS